MSDDSLCSLLEWDTAFFGHRIARIRQDVFTADDMSEIDKWCGDNAVDCLYLLARSDEQSTSRIAQRHEYLLMDIRITLGRSLSFVAFDTDTTTPFIVRPVLAEDINGLKSIAKHNHTYTRFYADERFPRHLCDALYETWIVQSCQGNAARVFVAEMKGIPVGYLSCHLDGEFKHGSIGLVGVDKMAQGQGIGQALVRRSLEWFAAQGMLTVSVVTQGRNIASQRLYQKNGFLTESVQLWYHKWYT